MTSFRYLPPVALAVSTGRFLSGRIQFPGDLTGKSLTMESGEVYQVFSDVLVNSPGPGAADHKTMLRVRFRFDRYSDTVNRRLFLLFTPIITGMPGIHRKIWSFCEPSGVYQGIYEFNSAGHAENYKNSMVLWILERRSVPGSISCQLLSNTSIADYLGNSQ